MHTHSGRIAAQRKTWNNGDISQALTMLKTHDLKATSKQMDVTFHSLRQALSRAGISVRVYRKAMKARKAVAHHTNRPQAFIAPSPIDSNRSELAMLAFERKRENGCSFPIGNLDEGEFDFCNEPRMRLKPYCEACSKRAYEPAHVATCII
jgi:hypothetical protein